MAATATAARCAAFSCGCMRPNGPRVHHGRAAESPDARGPPARDQAWQTALAKAHRRTEIMLRLAGEAGFRRAEIAQVHRRDLIDDQVDPNPEWRPTGNRWAASPFVRFGTASDGSEFHGFCVARTSWMAHRGGYRDAVRLTLKVVEEHSHGGISARAIRAHHFVIRRRDRAAFADHRSGPNTSIALHKEVCEATHGTQPAEQHREPFILHRYNYREAAVITRDGQLHARQRATCQVLIDFTAERIESVIAHLCAHAPHPRMIRKRS